MTEPVKPRRRGAALEGAVLDAAWVEIAEHGYAAFTVDGVATRAGTSKAVLYRRWPDRAELARAAIARFLRRDPMIAPETGILRGDVIALLQQASGSGQRSSRASANFRGRPAPPSPTFATPLGSDMTT